MNAAVRQQFSRIKKLLLSRDRAQIIQGAELVASLDEAEIWEALLGDVTFELDVVRPDGRWRLDRTLIGRLKPGKVFPANSKSIYWDEGAVTELVARSRFPVRDQVTHLSMGFSDFNVSVPPFLGSLADFPNLTAIDIALGPETDFSPLRRSQSLRSLTIGAHQQGPPVRVDGVESLTRLAVNRCPLELSDLPNLRELRYAGKGLTAEQSLDSVEQLELYGNDDYGDSFRHFPNASALKLDIPFLKDTTFPQGLTLLDGEIRVTTKSSSLTNIDELKGLELVSFRDNKSDMSIETLARCEDLRVLDLRNSGITDLSPLAGHPTLVYLAVNGSNVDVSRVPEDLEPLLSYAKNPDLDKARKRKRPKPKTGKSRKPNRPAILDHELWPTIEKDLAGSGARRIHAGLDAAIGIGPEAIDYLLSRAAIRNNRLRLQAPFKLPFNVHPVAAIGRLLSEALPESEPAAKLRSAERLVVEGKFKRRGSEVDLTHISQFPNLDQLVVRNALSFDADVSGLPLRSLAVSAHGIYLNLIPSTLRRLMVGYGGSFDLSPVFDSQIEEVAFVGHEPGYYPPVPGNVDRCENLRLLRVRPMFMSETTHTLGGLGDITFAPVDLPDSGCKGITDKSWDRD